MQNFVPLTSVVLSIFLTASAFAQGTTVGFGSGRDNSDDPIEVTAENLMIDQDKGTALYTGNVIAGQGDMRLLAPRVLVIANDDQSEVEKMEARGGVTLISGEDAAEAEEADFLVAEDIVLLRGDVLMTQGLNAITSDEAVIDNADGTAVLTGRVKSIFQPNDDADN